MSQPAVSWVIENSPYKGSMFLLHIICADTVDGRLELRVSNRWLARTSKVHRTTADKFITRATADGFLEYLRDGPRGARDYRFLLPEPGTEMYQSTGTKTDQSLTTDWYTTGTKTDQNGTPLAYSGSHSSSSVTSKEHTRGKTKNANPNQEPPDYPEFQLDDPRPMVDPAVLERIRSQRKEFRLDDEGTKL